MESLAALSLVAAVVQFVDFSTKLIRNAKDIYQSSSGLTKENQNLEYVVGELEKLSLRLVPPVTGQQNDDELALCRLAYECRKLSNELLKLFKELMPRDSTSKRAVVRSTLKGLWNNKSIQALEKRLDSCRSQLALQLTSMASSDNKARFLALVSKVDSTFRMLQGFQKQVNELHAAIEVKSSSIHAQEQMQTLLALSNSAREAIAQTHIRKSLAFPDMYGRFDAVENAHYETFRWILEDSATDRSRDLQKTSKLFTEWLSSGNGIFHIAGKLGSGKSTLMKFLCDHNTTKTRLQEWAGTRKLVVSSFFFWKPGSRLQKSLAGLLRSLLYSILKSYPELTSIAFPNHWRQATSASAESYLQEETSIRDQDIRDAFTRVIKHRDTQQKHCFCFFIDGLDEYEETPQTDYKDVVKLLQDWTTSLDSVKLCVSSREYNVFVNAFTAEKRIRLQDLTRPDMSEYVSAKLQELDSGNEKDELIKKILDRSSGIFLWVVLVVKNLRDCFEDGCNYRTFQKVLDQCPDELEGLFDYLLASIRKSSRTTAFRTFEMISTARHYKIRGGISLLAWSFFKDYENDQEFALRENFQHSKQDTKTLKARMETAQKELNGCCKGLVEMRKPSSHGGISGFSGVLCLDHTHRSITEFLRREDTQAKIAPSLVNFNTEDALSQMVLAVLQIELPSTGRTSSQIGYKYEFPWSENGWSRAQIKEILIMRSKVNLDSPPYHFLCRWETTSIERWVHCKNWTEATWHRNVYLTDKPIRPAFDRDVECSPFFESVVIGLDDYVRWKLQHDDTIVDNKVKLTYLLDISWALDRGPVDSIGGKQLPKISWLLDKYWIRTVPETEVDDATTWSWLKFLHYSLFRRWVERDKYIRGAESLETSLFGKSIISFLKIGADPRVGFASRDDDRVRGLRLKKLNQGGDMMYRMRLMSGKDDAFASWYHITLKKGELPPPSLQALVKGCKFNNEKEILDLIEERTRVYNKTDAARERASRSPHPSTNNDLEQPNITSPNPSKQIEAKPEVENSDLPFNPNTEDVGDQSLKVTDAEAEASVSTCSNPEDPQPEALQPENPDTDISEPNDPDPKGSPPKEVKPQPETKNPEQQAPLTPPKHNPYLQPRGYILAILLSKSINLLQ